MISSCPHVAKPACSNRQQVFARLSWRPTPAAADGRHAPPEGMLRDNRVVQPHKSRPTARR